MRRQWWSDRTDSVSWTGGVVALATTLGVFMMAVAAMTTLRATRFDDRPSERARAVRVQLTPPVERTKPVPSSPPTPHSVEPVPAPSAPATGQVPVDRPPPAESPPAARVEPIRDTSAVAAKSIAAPSIPRMPARETTSFGGGAPKLSGDAAPAGVTSRKRTITTALRDTIIADLAGAVPAAAHARKATADELDQLRRQREPGLDPHGRAARLPGEPVFAPTMGGNVSVGITMLTITLPGGPDRKKNDSIDADNQLRLRRLQDRALLRRDSVRADSLRRDSIARSSRRP